jgi:predicted ATPase/class 3 adenylate cyclase/DNA-binding CsgD family transcriptional regulator
MSRTERATTLDLVDDDGGRALARPLFLESGVTGTEERAFSLPTGTVAFLLTDIEGSTRRWEEAPEAMTVAVPRHYELIDAAIVGHGGVRPVEQGEGDSVVGAFSRASDAVAAAVAAQRALVVEPWPEGADLRVRMVVHTGEAQLREEGYYVGHALNRAARIRGTAHGGQVVVSAATAALVAGRLPAGTTLADLGEHRLKDLGASEHIWQVVNAELPSAFPPLRSLQAFHHNLPLQLTPLIGREREIVEVRDILAPERLVTLTGAGGVGKTRLALAVAAEALDTRPGGVWWVELAPLADPGSVGRAALAAIGVRDGSGPVVQQLAVELGDQPSLLVLDNCEHVVDACAELVTSLLSASPSVSVLTTSREPLGVPGEITWRVPSMRCPRLEGPVDPPTLSQYDAVVLFVERARRARPSFAVSDANAPAIAQVCHRLDGIPLALELAAARCRQLSAERIAAELDDRFRLLTGGARTVMGRQQTLAASVDWSHERLAETEQLTFRRLGVFAARFPLEAAEAVVGSFGDIESAEVFDLVSRLVDKSLVTVDEGRHGEPRYRLLETLRAYARDRARAAGELTRLRDVHATWWADWLEPRGTMPTDDVLDEIDEYHADLAAALDWSADQPALGLRILRCVAVAWEDLGRAGDAMAAADVLLTAANAERLGTAWLEAAVAAVELHFLARGTTAYGERLEQIESVAEQIGDDYHRGLARWRKESTEARIAVRDQARQRGDRYLDAQLTISLAAEVAEEDPAAAVPLLQEATAAAAASGMRSLRDLARFGRAEAAAATGDLAEAIALATDVLASGASTHASSAIRALSVAGLLAEDVDALRLAVDVGDRQLRTSPGLAPWTHTTRQRLALLEGRPSLVHPNIRDRSWSWPSSAGTLWLICREAIDAGDPVGAVEHIHAWSRPDPHARAVLAAVEAAAASDEERWQGALAIALDHGLRLIAVDALEGIAVAAARHESWNESSRLLGAAERLRHETGYSWRFSFEQHAVATARAAADAALEAHAESARTAGSELDWREAGAYARRARGQRRRPQHGWESLTPTEQQVVALVVEGLTNPQIARRLLMGTATVKSHLEHVFTKLAVHTRAELAAAAARRASPELGHPRL